MEQLTIFTVSGTLNRSLSLSIEISRRPKVISKILVTMKMWRWSVILLLFIHSIHADRVVGGKSSTEEFGPQVQPSIESDNRRQFFINAGAIPGPGVIFFTATYYITQFLFGAFFLINGVVCALFRTCSTDVVPSTSTSVHLHVQRDS